MCALWEEVLHTETEEGLGGIRSWPVLPALSSGQRYLLSPSLAPHLFEIPATSFQVRTVLTDPIYMTINLSGLCCEMELSEYSILCGHVSYLFSLSLLHTHTNTHTATEIPFPLIPSPPHPHLTPPYPSHPIPSPHLLLRTLSASSCRKRALHSPPSPCSKPLSRLRRQ